MKKIFSLFSALLLTVSMWGANEYNATISGDVTLTDLSYDLGGFMVYKYQLDFAQVGVNSSGTPYNSTVCMILEPLEQGLAGTYKLSDYSMNSGSFVKYGSAYRYVCDYTGKPTEVVIKDNGDGSYTISGAFRTKSGSNYYYYYYDGTATANTFTPVAPDPYEYEPEKSEFSFTGTEYGKKFKNGVIAFTVVDAKYNEIDLNIYAESDALEAGTYTVGTQIQASEGFEDEYTPLGSCVYHAQGTFCIVSGSVTVAFSEDNKTMTMSGSLTTGKGSVFTVSASGANPWYVPEPETIELTVSKVSVSGKTNLILSLTATPNNFTIGINGTTLAGATIANVNYSNTYVDLDEYGYKWSNADDQAANTLSIEATDNTEEYKLNATIVCQNKNTYVMKDVIFTYHVPTPWDSEVEHADFAMNINWLGATNQISSKGWILCSFEDDNWNAVNLAFPTDTFTLAVGTYEVKDEAVKGQILASAGKSGYTQTPSYIYLSENYSDVYLYVRSGEISVSYAGDSIFMKGEVITYRGTKVAINCGGLSPWIVPGYTVTYGENITVAPDSITSGKMVTCGTEMVFTAADRTAEKYNFDGFFSDEAYQNVITEGVEGMTYTTTVTNADISVYAKYSLQSPTTSVNALCDKSHKAVKVLRKGKLWIERGEMRYNILGSKF